MPKGQLRKRYNISILPEVMESVKHTAATLGLSASQFIEITMKANTQMRGPVQDLMRGLFTDLIEADRSLTKEEKARAREIVTEEESSAESPARKRGRGVTKKKS